MKYEQLEHLSTIMEQLGVKLACVVSPPDGSLEVVSEDQIEKEDPGRIQELLQSNYTFIPSNSRLRRVAG